MSGFRVGVVVGPADVMDGIEQMTAVTSLRAPAYSQTLLVKWLVDDHDFIETRRRELYALQTKTAEALRSVSGLQVAAHRGTAYLFPDVSAFGVPDVTVAGRLRDAAKVIVSPGYQFGPSGVGHFRVCYARDESRWESALDRIVACLSDIAASHNESALAGHEGG
jgi:aspartate/methionine/tyrosine aminotransferase